MEGAKQIVVEKSTWEGGRLHTHTILKFVINHFFKFYKIFTSHWYIVIIIYYSELSW